MIITETVVINDKEYKHTYSSYGYQITRDGAIFDDAIDVMNSNYTYEEVIDDREATEEDYQKALERLGVDV